MTFRFSPKQSRLYHTGPTALFYNNNNKYTFMDRIIVNLTTPLSIRITSWRYEQNDSIAKVYSLYSYRNT